MTQRSTTLHLAARHCNHALDFYEQNAPYERGRFAAGIAAHAVLQDAAQRPDAPTEALADEVVRQLTTVGRAFDGMPEPPLPVAAALEGRDLALSWLAMHGIPEGAKAEAGLAVDGDWQPCAYSAPEAHWRAAIDLYWEADYEDEDLAARGIIVRDWKSAWPTDADETETVQLRGQALLAVAHHPEADFVTRQVVNLRTGRLYEATLWLDDEGRKTHDRWRRDLDLAIHAAEHRGPDGTRPAAPGAGCLGCPYLLRCEPARAHLRGGAVVEPTAEAIAVRLAVVEAARERLIEMAKAALEEGSVPVPGGVVGYVAKEQREPAEASTRSLAHAWFHVVDARAWDAEHGELLGLLQALKPGVSALENAAKVLHPFTRSEPGWKERREALLSDLLATRTVSRFGVHKTPAGEAA
jgi:hypothetical protein